jgi:phosphosulfolactate synthase
VETILAGGADPDRLLFEAPTKDLQTQFITLLGPNVNLGNVSLGDVIALETLRLGLRGDTLLHFEAASIYA